MDQGRTMFLRSRDTDDGRCESSAGLTLSLIFTAIAHQISCRLMEQSDGRRIKVLPKSKRSLVTRHETREARRSANTMEVESTCRHQKSAAKKSAVSTFRFHKRVPPPILGGGDRRGRGVSDARPSCSARRHWRPSPSPWTTPSRSWPGFSPSPHQPRGRHQSKNNMGLDKIWRFKGERDCIKELRTSEGASE